MSFVGGAFLPSEMPKVKSLSHLIFLEGLIAVQYQIEMDEHPQQPASLVPLASGIPRF